MDIRARLLLTFLPLLAALIFFAAILPLGVRQTAMALRQQQNATADLIRGQELILTILIEHNELGLIVEGESPPDSERYRSARRDARAIVQAQVADKGASAQTELDIIKQYALLSGYYGQVTAAAAAGDLPRARALYRRPEVLEVISTIISLGQNVRDANRGALEAIATAIIGSAQQGTLSIGIGFMVAILLAIGLTWLLLQQIVRPIDRLAADAERYTLGDLGGQLSPAGNIGQLQRLRDAFQGLIDTNYARQQRIQSALSELEERVAREERLRDTVQALSVPVVPLQHDALLLPLVGYFDERRGSDLIRELLAAIQRRRAQRVLLDITGLADLDSPTIATLGRAAEASRLLGCSVYLIGVRASQALALAATGSLLSGITVARDVPSVLAQIGRP